MKTIMPRGLRHFELNWMRVSLYFVFCAILSAATYIIAPYLEMLQKEIILDKIADGVGQVHTATYISSVIGVLGLLGLSFLPSVVPNKPFSYFLRIVVL